MVVLVNLWQEQCSGAKKTGYKYKNILISVSPGKPSSNNTVPTWLALDTNSINYRELMGELEKHISWHVQIVLSMWNNRRRGRERAVPRIEKLPGCGIWSSSIFLSGPRGGLLKPGLDAGFYLAWNERHPWGEPPSYSLVNPSLPPTGWHTGMSVRAHTHVHTQTKR